jgi:hypothetical protein
MSEDITVVLARALATLYLLLAAAPLGCGSSRATD